MLSNNNSPLLLLLFACCISLVFADTSIVTCPSTQYDVQYGALNVTCSLSVSCPLGINWYWLTGTLYRDGFPQISLSPDDNKFIHVGGRGQVQHVAANMTFVLLQYTTDGNYTVNLEANCYSTGCWNQEGPDCFNDFSTYSTISVAHTKNDQESPIIRNVFVPEVGAGEYTIPVTVYVTDDFVGVQGMYINVQYQDYWNTGGIYNGWSTPIDAPRSTNLTVTVLLHNKNPLIQGVYDLYIGVTDGIGLFSRYDTQGLHSAGLQSTVTIGPTVSVPVLDSILVPPIIKYGDSLTVLVSAFVPNGVSTVTVKAYRSDFLIGSASYYANPNNSETKVYTELTVQIPVGAPAGLYYVDVTLINKIGAVYTYENVNNSMSPSTNMSVTANFTLVKSGCPAGRYKQFSAASNESCALCPIGAYSGAGEFRCHACAPGFFSTVNGSSACQPCPAGTIGIGGSWACSPCAINYYNDQVGQFSCKPCAPGYVRGAGETTCRQCRQGTYTKKGSSDCFECPAGSYSTDPSGDCILCPAGTYNPNRAYTQCWKCPENTFSSGGFSQCTPCDGGKKGPAGSNSKLNCYNA